MSAEFDEFLSKFSRLRDQPANSARLSDAERKALDILKATATIDAAALTDLIERHPHAMPFLVSCVGLSQEQLKGELKRLLGVGGWVKIARREPKRLIQTLDLEFGLVEAVSRQHQHSWSFVDVLVERRVWSQHRATASQNTGRQLEDLVEEIIKSFDVPYKMRTRFDGRGNEDAPCDFAIPAGGRNAQIVGAIKGFDSTGSKLTDAVTEVTKVAEVRLPGQYVYAVVDGIGWLRRQADLKRIFELYEQRRIDGLYTKRLLDSFKADLSDALRRLNLLK
ncbi:MAG TPA: hypothetical protein ENJ91_10945 [Rhodobacteraceae bacterium]|nr:hypothetical protein [Paracoccaceae bacterium]